MEDIRTVDLIEEIKLVDLVKDYLELEEIVESSKLSLEELCKKLNGHNLDEELFDLYYGKEERILATVYKNDNGFYVGQNINYWIGDMWIDIDMGGWVDEDTLIKFGRRK